VDLRWVEDGASEVVEDIGVSVRGLLVVLEVAITRLVARVGEGEFGTHVGNLSIKGGFEVDGGRLREERATTGWRSNLEAAYLCAHGTLFNSWPRSVTHSDPRPMFALEAA
jgi:hypothetical protein